jgi:hypothetical protein
MSEKCKAPDCDKELEGGHTKFCGNRCKQSSKYAVKMGKQCKSCYRHITKPVPKMGGFNRYCRRTEKCRVLHDMDAGK